MTEAAARSNSHGLAGIAWLVRALVILYFGVSFSYAHLPLATVHHSLGSLFNFVGAAVCALALLGSGELVFRPQDLAAIAVPFMILVAGLLGQVAVGLVDGVVPFDPVRYLRSAGGIASLCLPILAVILNAKAAQFVGISFKDVARASRVALCILIGYMAIELMGSGYGIRPFSDIVRFVAEHLNYRSDFEDLGGRLRGFSNEPSYFAIVSVFMAAVLLVDRNVTEGKRYFLLVLLIGLSAASLSKNVMGGLLLLLAVHAAYRPRLVVPLALGATMLVSVYLFFLLRTEGILWQFQEFGIDFSTITRVGSWVAAWNGFLDRPFFGHGIGSAGSDIVHYYPSWFFNSPEALDWESKSGEFGAPVFSNIFRTLFEQGVIGVAFVVSVLWCLRRMSNGRSMLSHDNAILVAGFLVSYGMVDILTYWPWYLMLAIQRPDDEAC